MCKDVLFNDDLTENGQNFGIRTLYVLPMLYTTHDNSTLQVFVLKIHSRHLPFTTSVTVNSI